MISQYSRLLNYAPAARINLTRSTLQLANHHRLEHTPVEAKSVELIHRIDIRVGRILKIERHPDADSLYVEQVDVGDTVNGLRTIVSGLVKYITIDDLQDKYVIVVKNMKPIKLRGIESYGMLLCASNQEGKGPRHVEILEPPEGSVAGERVWFESLGNGIPDEQLKPKQKVLERVATHFSTSPKGVALYKGIPFRTDKGVVQSKSIAEGIIS